MCGQLSDLTSSLSRENSSQAQRTAINGIGGAWLRKGAFGSGWEIIHLDHSILGSQISPPSIGRVARWAGESRMVSALNVQWLIGPGTAKTLGMGLSMNERCSNPSPRYPVRPMKAPEPDVNAATRTTLNQLNQKTKRPWIPWVLRVSAPHPTPKHERTPPPGSGKAVMLSRTARDSLLRRGRRAGTQVSLCAISFQLLALPKGKGPGLPAAPCPTKRRPTPSPRPRNMEGPEAAGSAFSGFLWGGFHLPVP